jgi:GxxExxY protein
MEINDLTSTIIGRAYRVHNTLGSGFLEKVYENALRIELEKAGIYVKQREKLLVRYEGKVVGKFSPDLWIDGQLIIEE